MASLITSEGVSLEYTEIPGSPQESYTAGEGQVRRVFLVDWEDRWQFSRNLLGYSVSARDSAGRRVIQRKLPSAYSDIQRLTYGEPFYPNEDDEDPIIPVERHPWLYASSIESITGIGPSDFNEETEVNIYRQAKITVLYESKSYQLKDLYEFTQGDFDQIELVCLGYQTKFRAPEVESTTLPFGQMLFVDDQTTAYNGTHALRNFTDIFFVWHEVPRLQFSQSKQMLHTASFLGCVNSSEFLPLSAPPGCLLMVGAQETFRWMSNGDPCSDITFRFKNLDYDATGAHSENHVLPLIKSHNHFPKFAGGSYQYVPLTTNGRPIPFTEFDIQGGNTIYPYRDFNNLFQLIS